MARKGWHQNAIDKLHESLATTQADREAMQAIVQGHIESQMTTAAQPNGG